MSRTNSVLQVYQSLCRKCRLLLLCCLYCLASVLNVQAHPLKLLHTVTNGHDNIVGLDNVRQILYHRPTHQLVSASADDNAVTAFQITDDYGLKTRSIIRSADVENLLEGAVSIAFSPSKEDLFLASFYSGSVIQFGLQPELNIRRIFSDKIPHTEVFAENNTVSAAEDSLKLLGPYALAASDLQGLVYVAAYKSESLNVFRKTATEFQLKNLLNAQQDISLAEAAFLSVSQGEQPYLAVAGGKHSRLSVYRILPDGGVSLKQTFDNQSEKQLDNPSAISFRGKANDLFVATKTSVLVYKLNSDGNFYQFANLAEHNNCDLNGITAVSFNPTGDMLFLLSEQSNKVHILTLRETGEWSNCQSLGPVLKDGTKALGPTSVAFFNNDKHLAISFAQSDAVNVYTF